jgi:hypothetical protein
MGVLVKILEFYYLNIANCMYFEINRMFSIKIVQWIWYEERLFKIQAIERTIQKSKNVYYN